MHFVCKSCFFSLSRHKVVVPDSVSHSYAFDLSSDPSANLWQWHPDERAPFIVHPLGFSDACLECRGSSSISFAPVPAPIDAYELHFPTTPHLASPDLGSPVSSDGKTEVVVTEVFPRSAAALLKPKVALFKCSYPGCLFVRENHRLTVQHELTCPLMRLPCFVNAEHCKEAWLPFGETSSSGVPGGGSSIERSVAAHLRTCTALVFCTECKAKVPASDMFGPLVAGQCQSKHALHHRRLKTLHLNLRQMAQECTRSDPPMCLTLDGQTLDPGWAFLCQHDPALFLHLQSLACDSFESKALLTTRPLRTPTSTTPRPLLLTDTSSRPVVLTHGTDSKSPDRPLSSSSSMGTGQPLAVLSSPPSQALPRPDLPRAHMASSGRVLLEALDRVYRAGNNAQTRPLSIVLSRTSSRPRLERFSQRYSAALPSSTVLGSGFGFADVAASSRRSFPPALSPAASSAPRLSSTARALSFAFAERPSAPPVSLSYTFPAAPSFSLVGSVPCSSTPHSSEGFIPDLSQPDEPDAVASSALVRPPRASFGTCYACGDLADGFHVEEHAPLCLTCWSSSRPLGSGSPF